GGLLPTSGSPSSHDKKAAKIAGGVLVRGRVGLGPEKVRHRGTGLWRAASRRGAAPGGRPSAQGARGGSAGLLPLLPPLSSELCRPGTLRAGGMHHPPAWCASPSLYRLLSQFPFHQNK